MSSNKTDFFLAILSLLSIVQGQPYDNLDHLGEEISAKVAAQVAPLQGLGARISAQVQQDLAHLEGLGARISTQVQQNLNHMQVNVNNRFSDLNNLGQSISQSVYDGLEPVRAIESNLKMRDGVGGVTIASHHPGGRQFVIKNYQAFICPSRLDRNTGQCSSSLTPFKITSASPRSDWCYINNQIVRSNNYICLSTNALNVQTINDIVNCQSPSNDPVIKMTLDEYKRLCSNIRQSTEFRYIPDLNDGRHVDIPNPNPNVKCENQKKDLCIFHEDNQLLRSSSNGGFSFQSRGGFSTSSVIIN